jgi:lysophospholipase L1-like esterase
MYWNKLLDVLQQSGAKIVVLDLTPVVEDKYTEDASLTRYNTDVVRYNEIIKQICKERKIAFFERYEKWAKRDLNTLYEDATHPNAKGHHILAEEVFEYLKQNKFLK